MGYKKDKKGNTIHILSYGFTAKKANSEIMVFTRPYKLGIYVIMYQDNQIYNQVSKDTESRLNILLTKMKAAFKNQGYTVEDLEGKYKIKRNPSGFFLKPHNYKDPLYSGLKK